MVISAVETRADSVTEWGILLIVLTKRCIHKAVKFRSLPFQSYASPSLAKPLKANLNGTKRESILDMSQRSSNGVRSDETRRICNAPVCSSNRQLF
jgi:hypothetical protein